MAKKKSEEVQEFDGNSIIANLIDGTSFQLIGSGAKGKGSLSDKLKVETPIYALNDLLGGGLSLGMILEVFGPNASGKSSLMYETLGNFQRKYPNGVAFIIDSEASTDDSRLRQLGVDPSRAPRMGASTLEDGFEQIIKVLKKMSGNPAYDGFPVMIIWDTIAGCPTRAQSESGNMYGGGMAEVARILKTSLKNIFPLVDSQNVLLILLNQVMADIGGWRPGITSAGGNALQHDIHMRLKIEGGRTNYSGIYPTEKLSTLTIAKSKVSPIIGDMDVVIDITQGGVVNRSKSLVWWINKLTNPAVFKQGSWWTLEEWVYTKYKLFWDKIGGFDRSFRGSYVEETASNNPNFVNLLRLIWIDLFSERYVLQREVCKSLRGSIETELMMNLGVSYEELYPSTETVPDDNSVVSDLESLLGSEAGGGTGENLLE